MAARLDTITDTLKQALFELQRLKENEAHEREKMGLRLENALLRPERYLLASGADEPTKAAILEEKISGLEREVQNLKERGAQLEKQ